MHPQRFSEVSSFGVITTVAWEREPPARILHLPGRTSLRLASYSRLGARASGSHPTLAWEREPPARILHLPGSASLRLASGTVPSSAAHHRPVARRRQGEERTPANEDAPSAVCSHHHRHLGARASGSHPAPCPAQPHTIAPWLAVGKAKNAPLLTKMLLPPCALITTVTGERKPPARIRHRAQLSRTPSPRGSP